MRVCSPSQKRIPRRRIQIMDNDGGMEILDFEEADLQVSVEHVIFRISNNNNENSHKSWMNHSGPVPLTTQRKYKAGCFREASTVCRAIKVLK